MWLGILLGMGVAFLLYALWIGWLVVAGRMEDAQTAAQLVPDLAVLFRLLLADDRVPRRRKLVFAALVGYLALPFDLVPDFIPVAGYLDDAVLVAFVLRHVLRGGGRELIEEHWPGPPASLALILRLGGWHGGGAGAPQLPSPDGFRER